MNTHATEAHYLQWAPYDCIKAGGPELEEWLVRNNLPRASLLALDVERRRRGIAVKVGPPRTGPRHRSRQRDGESTP